MYVRPVFESDDDSLQRNIGETVSFKRCIVNNLVECEWQEVEARQHVVSPVIAGLQPRTGVSSVCMYYAS